MEKKRKQIAIVTGASSGIGREFVRQIAAQDTPLQEIWLIARREEALRALVSELGGKVLEGRGKQTQETAAAARSRRMAGGAPAFRILPLDLGKEASFEELARVLSEEQPQIRLLINSAGMGFAGKVEDQQFAQALPMVDVNCRALTAVTMLALPYLRRGGRIIQMASASAYLPQPGFAVYAASKAYVLSFSHALRAELEEREISVTAVCPGPVKTDFFANGGITLSPCKRLFQVKPERVVRLALRDAAKGRAESVCGLPMKVTRAAAKLFPKTVMTKLSAKLFCLTPKKNSKKS